MLYMSYSQNSAMMCASWPSCGNDCDLVIGVTRQLHVDAVEPFAVDIEMFGST